MLMTLLHQPMKTHEVIIMGMCKYIISHIVPKRPMKMRFFKIAATSPLKEGTAPESYIFIIYLLLMGLMGIMGFCSIVNCLEYPLNNSSWVIMGVSISGKKAVDERLMQN